MLDQCFRCRDVVVRLRAGPFGGMLDEFAAYLCDRGYTYPVVQHYLRAADRFTRWVARRGQALDDVGERLVQFFLRGPGKHLVCPTAVPGLRHLLFLLRVKGLGPPAEWLAPPAKGLAPPPSTSPFLAEYDAFLRDVAGLAPNTRRARLHYAREFLRGVFGDSATQTERLLPKHVHAFVAGFGRAGHVASVPVAASAVRRFIYWLQLQGRCPASLVLAVPSFRTHRHTSLPKAMTDRQIRAFLATFDRSSPVGRRDYAMALCQLDLGLRAAEVIALALDDVDWHNGTIRIRADKSRRDRLLPLSKRVGRAMVEFLRRGRPKTTCRSLFVRFTRPFGAPLTYVMVRRMVGRAFAKADDCANLSGTHVLRHTAATRLYRRGASLKQVADILGHRCLDTTAIYAKVNLQQLAAVALPWPKGGQS